jgi:hypothetical protein
MAPVKTGATAAAGGGAAFSDIVTLDWPNCSPRNSRCGEFREAIERKVFPMWSIENRQTA